MNRFLLLLSGSLLISSLFGCSIDVSQPTLSSPTLTPTTPPDGRATPAPQTTKVPVTWASLNLTGKLIYLSSDTIDGTLSANIQMLDLSTGEIKTIFPASTGGWVFYVTISPGAKQLVMSYIPPSKSSSSPSRILYTMPWDAVNSLQPLFTPPSSNDHYTQAEWSPDGKYIYCVHYNDNDPPLPGPTPDYDILRMAYPDGQPERILEHAFWPRLSPDSTRLVYVSLDPSTGRNALSLANADGSDPQKIAISGSQIPDIVDAPIFSPDGQTILFSVPTPTQTFQPNWLDKLTGVQVAKAHSIPSDWWSVPVTGGVPTQLTHIQTINLFASISPDKKYMASVSGEGILVMDFDGSNLTRLISDQGVHGTVSWIP